MHSQPFSASHSPSVFLSWSLPSPLPHSFLLCTQFTFSPSSPFFSFFLSLQQWSTTSCDRATVAAYAPAISQVHYISTQCPCPPPLVAPVSQPNAMWQCRHSPHLQPSQNRFPLPRLPVCSLIDGTPAFPCACMQTWCYFVCARECVFIPALHSSKSACVEPGLSCFLCQFWSLKQCIMILLCFVYTRLHTVFIFNALCIHCWDFLLILPECCSDLSA